ATAPAPAICRAASAFWPTASARWRKANLPRIFLMLSAATAARAASGRAPWSKVAVAADGAFRTERTDHDQDHDHAYAYAYAYASAYEDRLRRDRVRRRFRRRKRNRGRGRLCPILAHFTARASAAKSASGGSRPSAISARPPPRPPCATV